MRRRKTLFILCLMVSLYQVSCTKNSTPGNNSGGTAGTGCSGNPGALFNNVRSILVANCALSGCHAGSNPQNGLNFTDNCTIVSQKDHIKLRAVDQAGTANQMPPPPNPTLSAADRQKITDWVNAGGKITD